MLAVRVSLSSGEEFYVDAPLEDVRDLFTGSEFVRVGGRIVNPAQVAQITIDRDVASIHTPETLEERDGDRD